MVAYNSSYNILSVGRTGSNLKILSAFNSVNSGNDAYNDWEEKDAKSC